MCKDLIIFASHQYEFLNPTQRTKNYKDNKNFARQDFIAQVKQSDETHLFKCQICNMILSCNPQKLNVDKTYWRHWNQHIILFDLYMLQLQIQVADLNKARKCFYCNKVQYPNRQYFHLMKHLRTECLPLIELNRFYARTFLTSFQQLFAKTLNKQLILFVLDSPQELKLTHLEIVLAVTPQELFILKEDNYKVFEKIAELYLIQEQELQNTADQILNKNKYKTIQQQKKKTTTIKEELLRLKQNTGENEDMRHENQSLSKMGQNQFKRDEDDSDGCVIVEQSGLIVQTKLGDKLKFKMVDDCGSGNSVCEIEDDD